MTQTVTQIRRFRVYDLTKLLKVMVGTTGFEPATSSVSKPLYQILSTTYKTLETA
jgi:hypothetical protein